MRMMMRMIQSDSLGRYLTVSVIFALISGCVASHGDSSHPYRKCLKVCHTQLSFCDFHYLPHTPPPDTCTNEKTFRPVFRRFACPLVAIIRQPTCAFTSLNRCTFDCSGGTASPNANTIACGRPSTHSYAMMVMCRSFMASGLSSAGWACR